MENHTFALNASRTPRTVLDVSNSTGTSEELTAQTSSRGGSPEVSTPGQTHAKPFWDSGLNQGINVLVAALLCLTMLGLGCTVELQRLRAHLRRPVAVVLAAITQFVIMPLVAFLLALLFSLPEVAAVAVLLCGCCPGGNLSNIMAVLVNGDMNLSVMMTVSSTLLALLLMPLCLWIYSRAWINTPVVQLLPFGAILLTLCSTLIPIGLGVFIRFKHSRAAAILLKFLEQKYGYFHCKDCKARWESAYVWSTSNSFAEPAKRRTTLTESRTSPVKPADRRDAPAPSKCGTLTQRGHIVRTCAAGARVNDSRVTALSASNTLFDFDGVIDFLLEVELMECRK